MNWRKKDVGGLDTFAYNPAQCVVSYDFDLCGGEFLAEFIVGSSKVSLVILDNGGGVLV
jgi:hypothetical protein